MASCVRSSTKRLLDYRAVFGWLSKLCYLEGLTQEQAAGRVALPDRDGGESFASREGTAAGQGCVLSRQRPGFGRSVVVRRNGTGIRAAAVGCGDDRRRNSMCNEEVAGECGSGGGVVARP